MSMTETAPIEWREPPADNRGRSHGDRDWASIAAALRSRPGEWACVAQDVSPSTAAHIKTGRIVAMTTGDFDAVSRRRPVDGTSPRRFDIYARYIGSVSE